jgi:DNA-binding SARP family transcriptional activator/pimeloyl-ACP methyl ester carboxylesterase
VVWARLFGSFEVVVDGRCLGPRDFGGVKPKQLLEVLVVSRGRTVSKDELTELLWGESRPRSSAATLESYVSLLRSRLGSARGLVVTETRGYRLEPEGATVDVDEFESLLRQAAACGSAVERRDLLDRALGLVRGEVLADEPYAVWALDVRGVYAERMVQALCDLADACLVLGDFDRARGRAEQALRFDPVLERAHRAAMLAHYALGDEERALRAYERCRAALIEAVGGTPTPETAALHSAFLRRDDHRLLVPEIAAEGGRLPAAPPGSAGTRYAHRGDLAIAFQTLGDGRPDVVFMPGFVSHVEASWEDPTFSAFMRRLGRDRRLIIFDKPGTGLSDPVVEWPTFEERVDDLMAVMDGAGSERAVLLGVSEGAPLCALAAARYPERVSGIIMHAGFRRLMNAPGYPYGWTPEFFELYLARFEDAWTSGAGLEIINPSLAGDQRYIRWFARYLRLSASPGMTRRLMRMNAEIDIDDVLARIRVPTMITHRRDERWVSVEHSRYLASHIPGARLVELPGTDHQPWIGDVEPVHRAIDEFVTGLD